MSDAAGWVGMVSGGAALVTAVGVAYRGWRSRVATAAAAPYRVGEAAVDAARDALELKDAAIAELRGQREKLMAELSAARAQNESQQAQITSLYVQLGEVRGKNAELESRLASQSSAALLREGEHAAAVAGLQSQVDGLKKQIGLP